MRLSGGGIAEGVVGKDGDLLSWAVARVRGFIKDDPVSIWRGQVNYIADMRISGW